MIIHIHTVCSHNYDIIPKNVVEIQAMYVHYGYDLWLSWKLDMLDGWPGYDYGYELIIMVPPIIIICTCVQF